MINKKISFTVDGAGPLIVEISDISYDAVLAVMPMRHDPSNLTWLPKKENRKKKAATKKKVVKKKTTKKKVVKKKAKK